jgi:carbon starvation protein CstA
MLDFVRRVGVLLLLLLRSSWATFTSCCLPPVAYAMGCVLQVVRRVGVLRLLRSSWSA